MPGSPRHQQVEPPHAQKESPLPISSGHRALPSESIAHVAESTRSQHNSPFIMAEKWQGTGNRGEKQRRKTTPRRRVIRVLEPVVYGQ